MEVLATKYKKHFAGAGDLVLTPCHGCAVPYLRGSGWCVKHLKWVEVCPEARPE